jgi:D-amino-acid dehydrogenase
MTDPGRIAIVGAGINGVATAIWLSRSGLRPILFDPAEPGTGASGGNAGVLAASAVVPVPTPGLWRRAPRMALDPDQPLFLRWRYLPRLAPWLVRYLSYGTWPKVRRISSALAPLLFDALEQHQALSAGTEAAQYVVASDYVHLFADRASFEAGAEAWALRHAAGHQWRELEGPTLAAYQPGLGPAITFAAAIGGHGHISDPPAYHAALMQAALDAGARRIAARVTDIAHRDGRVTGVIAQGETHPCDTVIVTAGAWSAGLMRALGLRIPLETERGYHLDLIGASPRPKAPLMVSTGQFVMTPMRGRVRLAGVLEFGGLAAPASRAPFDLLRRQARAAFPGLTWEREERWMGHRPAVPDSLPLIGPIPGLTGAWAGFGHHHVGLTAGARTGRMLAQMITGTTPNLDTAPYAPARFLR